MKPVNNISLSAFAIGKTYIVEDEEEDILEITIRSIYACNVRECVWKNRKDACEEIMFIDEDGQNWCGMLEDFEEVKE